MFFPLSIVLVHHKQLPLPALLRSLSRLPKGVCYLVVAVPAYKPLGITNPAIYTCNDRFFHQYSLSLPHCWRKKLCAIQVKNVIPFFFNNQDSLLTRYEKCEHKLVIPTDFSGLWLRLLMTLTDTLFPDAAFHPSNHSIVLKKSGM